MKKITINDIAKKAGVSQATVSFVLNNKKSDIKISKKTRDKVLKIVKSLNYKPHILAKGLKSGKSTLVGVVFSEIWRENEAKLFEGIENFLSKNGYGIIFKTTGSNFEKEKQAIEFLLEKKVEGLIIQSALYFDEKAKEYIFDLEKKGIKMVIIGSENTGFNSPVVGFDDKLVGFIATKYLITFGHREIICLTNTSMGNIVGILRMEGYKEAMNKEGIEIKEEFINEINSEGIEYYRAGYEKMKEIIKKKVKFTAIFSHCDMATLGILKCLDESGLKVPADISVVSVDNESFSEYLNPPLTTINLDNYKLGEIAGETLLKLLNNKKTEDKFLKPEIIIRKSTKEVMEYEGKNMREEK
ncbi:LacI family DNA-binding transcriptional regulator [bacterium]|nr:LacI family DNA-binding transcriptional regulator [bacterium]